MGATRDEEAQQQQASTSMSYEEDDSDRLSTTDERKRDNRRCPQVNRKLLLPKAFYYCFFSAWGSLLPYLALYFKQLLLTPSQVGILMGLKPFVNFLATPVWGAIVDKFHIHKFAMVVSMIALITATFAQCLVPGPEQQKVVINNHCNRTELSDFMQMTGQEIDKMVLPGAESETDSLSFFFSKARWPWVMDFISTNLDQDPVHVKYKIDASKTFTSLFLITLFGTLIASPALALVDTATLQMLGKETHRYGKQRLTGSLGWGMGAFIVGASLQTTHRCSLTKNREIVDYIPCFYVFAVLMTLGLVVSIKFKFKVKNKGAAGTSLAVGLGALKSPTYVMFLFTALYLGFLMAFIKTFLFWHLKDLGGTQLLFSVISAVNCVAEVSMYFLSEKLIKKIGQIRVLYLGLICYSIRLFYYSVIPYTWLVLVVELLPGITTAAVWAACLSYVSLNSKPGAQTTMQCILHGVHWGLGYGAGEVIGGILVHHYGAPTTFVLFGILCIVVLLLYILINMIWGKKDKSHSRDDETQTDLDVNNLPEEERVAWEKAQEKRQGIIRGSSDEDEPEVPKKAAQEDAKEGEKDSGMPAIKVTDESAEVDGKESEVQQKAAEDEIPQASDLGPQNEEGTSVEEIELKEKDPKETNENSELDEKNKSENDDTGDDKNVIDDKTEEDTIANETTDSAKTITDKDS
eukprot:Seg1190.11 transcript_id=Seg1190.11/GoldUCD/mRNA.D3Y31 product="Major facilitator superfamily domain-containing protein 6" protein_id=Seg1190.11/GoldUCD/D3Y31